MNDLGGEPACWAHLADQLDTRDPSDGPTSFDLSGFGDDGHGALWSLPHGGDLDANLIRLEANTSIDRHVNVDVDVLVVVWAGSGELSVDDHPLALREGIVVMVPRGRSRAVRAGSDGVVYLSIHRRRGPLTIGRPK